MYINYKHFKSSKRWELYWLNYSISEHLLKVPLRVVENFHSHLEPMEHIRPDTFQDQVSFSYAHMRNQWNVVRVDGFDLAKDPKRFYSLHCKLFPYFSFCPPRWFCWMRMQRSPQQETCKSFVTKTQNCDVD